MKNRSLWLLAILWLVAAFWIFPAMNQPGEVPAPAVLMEQAQQLEEKAGDDKDQLKKVIKEYERVTRTKQYRNTEHYGEEAYRYAAEAQYRIAHIYEIIEDDRRAVYAYQSLTRNQKYGEANPEIVEQGAIDLETLQIAIDEKHAGDLGYRAIDYLVELTGRNPAYSYALALLIITLVFKAVTTPLSKAQFKGMREMQRLQPLLKQLQEKYKGDQQELGRKTMELYKEHGVNPLSSCLPLLLQMPILILLYWKVILPYQYQFQQGALLWIGSSLADKFPTIVGANLAMPDMPLLFLYVISMIISQKLTMAASDPSQIQMQRVMMFTMPILFAFIFRTFPSAFMLYWLFFNIISTVQQYLIMRQPGEPNAGGGGPVTAALTAPAPKAEKITPYPKPKSGNINPGKKGKRRKKKKFSSNRRPAWAARLTGAQVYSAA